MIKKSDYLLIIGAAVVLLFWLPKIAVGLFVVKLILGLLIISLLLYWKLFPYKAQMDSKYQQIMNRFQRFLTPILSCLRFVPQLKLGQNLTLDMGLFVICSLLIALLIIL